MYTSSTFRRGSLRVRVGAARWLCRWPLVAAAALVSACGGGDGEATEPAAAPGVGKAAFKVLPVRTGLTVDDEALLLALDAPGTVTWSSADPAVATVEADGRVRALAKGTAVIHATVDDPGAYAVSADGQSIEGRFTGFTPAAGTTTTTVWKFTAQRE